MKQALYLMLAIGLSVLTNVATACGKQVYGPKLSGFHNTPLELTEFDDIEAVSRFYGFYGDQDEGLNRSIESAKDPANKFSVMVTLTDNSVKDANRSAMQWRLGVNQMGDQWIVKTAGQRWKCLRGKYITQWTTKPCP